MPETPTPSPDVLNMPLTSRDEIIAATAALARPIVASSAGDPVHVQQHEHTAFTAWLALYNHDDPWPEYDELDCEAAFVSGLRAGYQLARDALASSPLGDPPSDPPP